MLGQVDPYLSFIVRIAPAIDEPLFFHRAKHFNRRRPHDAEALTEFPLRNAILLQQRSKAIPMSASYIVLRDPRIKRSLYRTGSI